MQQQDKGSTHFSGGLLDRLAELTGCWYLSDLCSLCRHETLLNAFEKLVPQDFSIEEWEDAAGYLLGVPYSFQTQWEAAQFLKKQLRAREDCKLPRLPSAEE